ncbi:MAG: HEAT repeat domain-containing protein [candidate division NC10 bacterium]|nr:HEAT repeat domain-containing protein [candidate division NC10 bacterium]
MTLPGTLCLALHTLARLGPVSQPAIPRLIAMLDEPDPSRELRSRAARVRGQNGPALPALRRSLLTDDQPKVRALAADALGAMRPRAHVALPDLGKALGDPDPAVRRQATRAIKSIGSGP